MEFHYSGETVDLIKQHQNHLIEARRGDLTSWLIPNLDLHENPTWMENLPPCGIIHLPSASYFHRNVFVSMVTAMVIASTHPRLPLRDCANLSKAGPDCPLMIDTHHPQSHAGEISSGHLCRGRLGRQGLVDLRSNLQGYWGLVGVDFDLSNIEIEGGKSIASEEMILCARSRGNGGPEGGYSS